MCSPKDWGKGSADGLPSWCSGNQRGGGGGGAVLLGSLPHPAVGIKRGEGGVVMRSPLPQATRI